MCGLCALLAGRGTGAPNESLFAASDDRIERDRHRRERLRQVRRILAYYRLALDDRGPQTLVLRNATDQLAGRPIDPLDPALLAHLAAGADA